MGNLSSVDMRLLATLAQCTGDKGQRVPSFEKEEVGCEDNLNYDHFSTVKKSTLQLVFVCIYAI